MKIRKLLAFLFIAFFSVSSISFDAHGFGENKPTSFKRTFSRKLNSGQNISDAGTTNVSSSRSYSSSSSTTYTSQQSEEWGVFGLTPRRDIKDRSIFPSPSCNINGRSIFENGPCMKKCGSKCMKPCGTPCNQGKCIPCEQPPIEIVEAPCPVAPCIQETTYRPPYITVMEDSLYTAVHRQCGDFAPIDLQFVDFRIPSGQKYSNFSNKLGNYRFRIFGCRRENKVATLNKGRIMQKDMQFLSVFEHIVGNCVPIVKVPQDLCLNNSQPLPEYVMTAEITDYFMNVCDQYDWDQAKKKDLRNGSAEMTVTWRIMDLTKTNILWKGTSTGYAEVDDGEYNGELTLVERAFADAVQNLRQQPGFEEQLATRVHPDELARQRASLISMQQELNPAKCQYQKEIIEVIEKQKCNQECPKCESCNKEVIVIKEEPVEIIYEEKIIEEVPAVAPYQLEEASGIEGFGSTVEENAGIITATEFNDGIEIKTICAENEVYSESGGVEGKGACLVKEITEDGDFWIEHKEENAAFDANNILCIVGRPPYDEMNAENVYTVRTAIVSIQNAKGEKGAGLLISDQFILTSADLITKENNHYDIETINGSKLKATAFRVNTTKNTALLLLDTPTKYTPLSLNTELPEIGKSFMSLGLLDLKKGSGEGYLENKGKITGYRYSEEIGAEIIVDTFVQTVTIGGALVDYNGTISGIAHSGKKYDDSPDLFMPIETAIKSVGLEICGQIPKEEKRTPISDLINKSTEPKDPAVMKKKDRK